MALTAGTRLGSYEIIAQIDVGGMGEVYRATDTKLDRFTTHQNNGIQAHTERIE